MLVVLGVIAGIFFNQIGVVLFSKTWFILNLIILSAYYIGLNSTKKEQQKSRSSFPED